MPLSSYLQHKILFRPARLPDNYVFRFDAPFEEHFIETPDHVRINALYFPTAQRTLKGVVLYFHGNRGNLQRWGAEHWRFTENGYDFFAADYRGYGKTPGTPSPDHLYNDALLLLNHLSHGYAADQIVLYGRSLGSAPATRLAAEGRAKSLILETPFDNLYNLFQDYMPLKHWSVQPAFDLPNDAYLKQTTLPVLIFHGTRDRVVPYASAARLKRLLKPTDQFVTIPGGSHHNLGESPLFSEHLAEWLR